MLGHESSGGVRVAVLDANRNFQSLMRTMLRQLGFRRVEVFGDPDAALTRVMETPIDLIFVEFDLAGINGIDWIKLVRRGLPVANAHMAIVMVSNRASRSVLEAAVAAGVDSFLAKPLAVDVLGRHIHRALNGRARYVSGPGGYWGPDHQRTRLRVRRSVDGRPANEVGASEVAFTAPERRAFSVPGMDVEIAPRPGYDESHIFLD